MKRLLFCIISIGLWVFFSLQAMEQPPKVRFDVWEKTDEHIPNKKWFTMKKGRKGSHRVIGIIIPPTEKPTRFDEDDHHRGLVEPAYEAIESLLEKIAPNIIKESARIQAKILTEAATKEIMLELITFNPTQNAETQLKDLIRGLYASKNTDIYIVIIAWGKGPLLVNDVSYQLNAKEPLDTLIYMESYINEKKPPVNYGKLYNLYTKKSWSVTSERKYRQQPNITPYGDNFILPVKNCAVYKDTLEGLFVDEFFEADFLLKLPQLIAELDKFLLNFDCAAVMVDRLKHTARKEVWEPKVVVNRFVEQHSDGSIRLQYDDPLTRYSAIPEYEVFAERFTSRLLNLLKRRFTQDVLNSSQNLLELGSLVANTGDKLYQDWLMREQKARQSKLFDQTIAEKLAKEIKTKVAQEQIPQMPTQTKLGLAEGKKKLHSKSNKKSCSCRIS